jgi:cobalt-zinc-cadmium efflux system membrane fusion protein
MPFILARVRIRWESHLAFVLLGMVLVASPHLAFAHAGHDHGEEFQQGSSQPVGGVRVDAQTAQRLGLLVEPVSKEFLDVGIQTTATIETQPDQQVAVNAPINGTVTELLVQPGDRVERGQPVAVVVAPELIELRVNSQSNRAQAQVELRQAQTNLSLAQQNYERQVAIADAEIEAAQRQLQFAQERYDRDQELVEAGAIARQQVLASESDLAAAQSQLTQASSRKAVLEAEAEIDRARASLEAAQTQTQLSAATYEARLQQLNSSASNEGFVTVVAPISGTVADRTVTLGEAVEEAVTPLVQIINGDRLLVTANVYEKDLAAVTNGQRVRATVASLPGQIFEGRVVVVGARVNGETRSIPVTAELENSNALLKPGMFAELELLVDRTLTAVLTVPTTALLEADGRTLVFVQNGDAFEPVEVTTGRRAGDRIEIINGLFEGDQVVVQGGLQLYAQSLRGDIQPAQTAAIEEPGEAVSRGLPWWTLLPVSGVIAAGAFVAGRRTRRVTPPMTGGNRVTLEELMEPESPKAPESLEKAGVE